MRVSAPRSFGAAARTSSPTKLLPVAGTIHGRDERGEHRMFIWIGERNNRKQARYLFGGMMGRRVLIVPCAGVNPRSTPARVQIGRSKKNRLTQLVGLVCITVQSSHEFEAQPSPARASKQQGWIFGHASITPE